MVPQNELPGRAGRGQTPPSQPPVLTVSQLTALVKETLESAFAQVWVSGELSDIVRPQSGHIYFTLKDAGAQVRAVMWRSAASRLRFKLEDGLEVVCGGGLDVYPPRGSYQLVVRQLEPRGIGALQLALRQLQQRLAAEGLFAAEHKRRLPRFPRRIAVVTSPSGAAIRDFLEVLRRRWLAVEVLVLPVRVQGAGAAEEIAAAVRTAQRIVPRPDVLVVTRGGGSLEDLWPFNEEAVVRALYAAEIPVISAVGHEIDVTLCDLVADVRALTPSEAAELVVPSSAEIAARLQQLRLRLASSLHAQAHTARAQLQTLEQHRVLRRPFRRLEELSRRLDELELRGGQAIRRRLRTGGERLQALACRLESLNPLAVLRRGYSITERTGDGQLIRSASQLKIGETIASRLSAGRVVSRVEQLEPDRTAADATRPAGAK